MSGTTGFDYATMTIAGDIESQTEQCLKNIDSALSQAGSSLADIVRIHYVLPDGSEFQTSRAVLRKYLGTIRPAATMISAKLFRPSHANRDRGNGPQAVQSRVGTKCCLTTRRSGP